MLHRERLPDSELPKFEACGFDFAATYGSRGEGFIEGYHVQPLHTIRTGSKPDFRTWRLGVPIATA
jgi:hypothetical protein